MCNKSNCDHGLNDSLDDLFDGPATPLEFAPINTAPKGGLIDAPVRAVVETRAAAHGHRYEEKCTKCNGTGIWYGGYTSGQCFECKGKGILTYKTSPESRAKARADAHARKAKAARTATEQRIAWVEAHPAEAEWLFEAAGRGFEFAVSLLAALIKYGHFSEKQFAAIQSATAKSAERQAQWAAERAERDANKAEINVDRLAAAFAKAKANLLKFPKIRLAGFVFSLAGANSTNAGAIYVKSDEGTYLGKVMGGRFSRSRDCTPALEPLIAAAAADPEKAASAYGLQTGTCSCCGRELTAKESVGLGIGPICREKWGW